MALCFNNIIANVATNANITFIAELKSAISRTIEVCADYCYKYCYMHLHLDVFITIVRMCLSCVMIVYMHIME